jgi:short-subunit dehydrogenase
MPASLRPVALITGASSGIGRQFALDYAAKGFDLVIVARSRDALESLAGELSATHGSEVVVHAGDLSQAADVAALVEAIAELPRLDHVIFSAGSAPEGDLTRIDPAALRSMIDLNIAALTLVNQAAIIRMRAASRGVIINIASVAGYQATPYLAAYGASKSYVRLFSEAISEENRKHGIRVLSVSPGDTVTPMNPGAAKGKRQPQDVVDTAWAALDGSAPSVVDGGSNRMLAALARVLPTRTGLRIAEKMFRDKA